jgi:hypothetical protein
MDLQEVDYGTGKWRKLTSVVGFLVSITKTVIYEQFDLYKLMVHF